MAWDISSFSRQLHLPGTYCQVAHILPPSCPRLPDDFSFLSCLPVSHPLLSKRNSIGFAVMIGYLSHRNICTKLESACVTMSNLPIAWMIFFTHSSSLDTMILEIEEPGKISCLWLLDCQVKDISVEPISGLIGSTYKEIRTRKALTTKSQRLPNPLSKNHSQVVEANSPDDLEAFITAIKYFNFTSLSPPAQCTWHLAC